MHSSKLHINSQVFDLEKPLQLLYDYRTITPVALVNISYLNFINQRSKTENLF